MILLMAKPTATGSTQAMAVIGLGLVGGALATTLRQRLNPVTEILLPISWLDPVALQTDLDVARQRIIALSPDSLTIAYCAGKAGFSATESQTDMELNTFRSVLQLAQSLADDRTDMKISMHMLSSAGGIFEGQVQVTASSRPSPQRPYGHLKLAQEELLWAASSRLQKQAHRLTSVYGPIHGQQRKGLVATLIYNGLRHHVTSIMGRPSTLRDFVWVGDVAAFLADRMMSEHEDAMARTTLLASGKPTSILEIQRLVERVIRQHVYVSYARELVNSLDITFSPLLRPSSWSPTDLQTNIHRIYQNCMSDESAFHFNGVEGTKF